MYRWWSALRQMDWWGVFAALALTLFGLAAIYSIDLSRQDGSYTLLARQLIAAGLGLGLFFFIVVADYRLLRSYSFVIYGSAVLLLAGVLFFGTEIRGTTGWYDLGGFHFQPVEYAKLALIVILAHYFSDRARRDLGLRECIESGTLTVVLVGLTLLQPDLGSSLLLVGTWGAFMLFAGMRKRYLAAFVVIAVLCAVLGWQFLADYQRARLTAFLDPTLDPTGEGYNVRQAIIAVGSGQLFGRGLGFGSQSQLKFLPESQTDFIFAVIAEELGFVGVVLLLCGFLLLFARIIHYASRTRDDFTSYLLIGIGSLLFLQFVVNVGMNVGLLPVTGIALPLVSYGGSSLLITLFMVGIVQSAVVRQASQRLVLRRD